MRVKTFFFLLAMINGLSTNAQLEQVWKTDYQITSDTFNTFGYKTDSAGNFYLYGWQHNRVFLQKHDPNGSIEWTINDNSIVANPDAVQGGDTIKIEISNSRITDVIVDNGQTMFIVGITSVRGLNEPNAESFVFVSKIASNGALLWKKNFSLEFSKTRHIPWNHNVFGKYDAEKQELYIAYGRQILFCTNNVFNTDFGLIKCDSSGNVIWNRWFVGDTANCTKDIVTSLFFRDTLITLSGFSTSSHPYLSRLVTISIDRNGNLVNRSEEKEFIADPYSDQPLNLYVPTAYTTQGQAKGETCYITAEYADSNQVNKRNLMVIKYDEVLNHVWRYDLQKDTAVNIEVEKSLMDDSCNVLVSAIWKENGEDKALFLKLDSAGQEIFRDTFSDKVETNGCFINPKGEYVLFTSAHIGSSYNTSLRKYSSSGEIVWDSTLTIPGKIIHGWVDSTYLYLVLLDNKTLSYLKFKDTNLSVGIPPASYGQVTVYPNPVSEVLCINSLQDSESYTYQIFSLTGLLLTSGKVKSKEIQLSGLAPGTYILILTDQYNHFSATKFIKQ